MLKIINRIISFIISFTLMFMLIPNNYTTSAAPMDRQLAVDALAFGDCNNDGNIDALDLALLKQNIMNQGDKYSNIMDLNQDNAVDAIDYSIMKQYLLGKVSNLPYNPSQPAAKWVGTWTAAQQLTEPANMPPSPGLTNNTLRQVVHVSIGGNQLRMKFSNQYGSTPVTMNSVHLAVSTGGSSIQDGTDKAVTFEGREAVTIPAGKTVVSDVVNFSLSKLKNIAITIYFGSVPSALTGHPGSRTISYIQTCNSVNSLSMPTAVTTEHWYIIAGIDVLTDDSCKGIVALGDSITDGRGSTSNANNRWTDNLSRRLRDNPSTLNISVLNQGIGGNAVLSGGLGPTALSRFQRDVLEQSGVRFLIVFEGVNDIGPSSSLSVATNLINAYKEFISKAHSQNILVYGATITPFGGSQYDSNIHEQARQTVNSWIRTSGQFDAVIDLDAAVKNPNDPTKLLSTYDSGDHLHLSPAGYEKVAEAIDINLFTL
ncbi:GDSL-type esterase/lipase family protein [Clostridium sp. BNL1100]|uniref:GDSL-type esterase/lipase family protein n=1 Tax=Clostridium sp. BNL1100 TaxID=755731 RepID=UPI00024A7702|nr:GDSL-type esterase/lipase family protein [Clostridium sp. BNL1100]AEY66494.1 lysophospholipase L1-like esterase [Clostridium sp. BNL1100]